MPILFPDSRDYYLRNKKVIVGGNLTGILSQLGSFAGNQIPNFASSLLMQIIAPKIMELLAPHLIGGVEFLKGKKNELIDAAKSSTDKKLEDLTAKIIDATIPPNKKKPGKGLTQFGRGQVNELTGPIPKGLPSNADNGYGQMPVGILPTPRVVPGGKGLDTNPIIKGLLSAKAKQMIRNN